MDHNENERKQKDRLILGSCRRAEKALQQENDSDTNHCWGTWKAPPKTGNWISVEETRHSIVKISSNTEKSSGDLRRLAVTYVMF